MFKKIISWMLLLSMAVLPLMNNVQAAETTAEMDLEAIIREQFEAYAASVDVENADDEALDLFISHARKGGDFAAGEGHVVTAMVLNSESYRYTFPKIAAAAILLMQDVSQQEMVLQGETSWYDHGYNCKMRQYVDDGNGVNTKGVPLGSNNIYSGTKLLEKLTPSDYDETLELVAGGTRSRMHFRQVENTGGTITYDVFVTVYDDFDFDGNYKVSADKGYDTSKAELLTLLGKLLGLKKFHWAVEAEFQLTVPNRDCTHGSHAYSWTYTTEKELIPNTEDGFTVNGVTKIQDMNSNGTLTAPYFRLDDTIMLRHDKPWVVELEGKKTGNQILAPTEKISSGYPFLVRTYKARYLEDGTRTNDQFFWGGEYRYYYLTEEEKEAQGVTSSTAYVRDYYGVDFTEAFTSKSVQTYRLENRIAEDGSNMVYLLVDGVEMGPMINHYITNKNVTSENQNAQYDWIGGRDFHINYIGNATYRMSTVTRSVTIWENGQDAWDGSHYEQVVTEPTCTERGYTTYTCRVCGDSYVGNYVDALGHTAVTDSAVLPTCTETGLTKGAHCEICEEVLTPQTVVEPLGHTPDSVTDCEQEKRCVVCEAVLREAAEHLWDSGAVLQNATCTEAGMMRYSCGTCGMTWEDPIPVLGHSYESAEFRWSEDSAAAAASAACDRCEETMEVSCVVHSESCENGTLTITAEAAFGEQIFTDTRVVSAVRNGDTITVTLPAVPERVCMWAAVYDENGAFMDVQIVEVDDTTVQVERSGKLVKLFFLREDLTPVFPCLCLK